MPNIHRARPSQALIIMTMVMAVSLVVGVAIASRVVTTLRQISYTEQSASALSFAESGVEQALKRLKESCVAPYTDGILCGPFTADVNGDGTNDFTYNISSVGNTSIFDALSPLERGKAAQVNLEGYSGSISVYWVGPGEGLAAMEISIVYFDGTEYKLKRDAYDPDAVRRTTENQFLAPGLGKTLNGVAYQYGVTINPLPGGSKLLRLRAIYSGASFAVEAQTPLPYQGEKIESTGFYGDIQRKVEVIRTLPALSELFDFVIFSGAGL